MKTQPLYPPARLVVVLSILGSLLLLALVAFGSPRVKADAPVLTYNDSTQTFNVTFDRGLYVQAITTFRADKETIVLDGKTVPYEPMHVWLLDPKASSFTDDWDFIEHNHEVWHIDVRFLTETGHEVRSNMLDLVW